MQHILTTAIEKSLSGSILTSMFTFFTPHLCPLKVSVLIQSDVSVIVCRFISGGPRNPNTAVNHFTCSLFTEQCSSYRHICLYLGSILPAIYLLKKCTQKHIFFRLLHFLCRSFSTKKQTLFKELPLYSKRGFL